MAEKNLDNVKINVEFKEPTEREALSSGDEVKSLFGKIKKYFTDLKLVAFSGSYNDLGDKPKSLPASDVYDWAKAETKPTYTADEVGADESGSADNALTEAKSYTDTKVSNHTHNYAGSNSAGGAANSAKKLTNTSYIDGIPFDGSESISRLGTCVTASNDTAKEVTMVAFDEEEASDAILYIQFIGTYEGGTNDTHTISINGGEPLVIYYQGAVFNWETFFSNYPFCDGQIHQFRYFWSPTGSYLELIAPSSRAVANNLTTTDEKIALAAPMGKQLAETDASLQEQISSLNSNFTSQLGSNFVKVYDFQNNGFDIASLVGSNYGLHLIRVAQTAKPSIGLPAEISQWGTLVVFNCVYRQILYISQYGEIATYGRDAGKWKVATMTDGTTS